MVLDFPYTVHDEPTDHWTVEQVMHWWLLRAHTECDASFEETVSRLAQETEKGKASLWESHEQVAEIVRKENADPQGPPKASLSSTSKHTTASATTSSSHHQTETVAQDKPVVQQSNESLHIVVMAGEYEGVSYDLKPTARAHAWVGRSQGKKFREKGISLPKDLEVSTTHGKFEIRRNKYYFMDEGSTNGSRVQGEDIEPKVPVELQNGMEITVGQTVMKVTLPY